MADSCLDVAAFLQATGSEFVTFGAASTGTLTVMSVGAPGDTVTIGGVALTAVAGARTPGSDDFSLVTATVQGVAQSLVDAVNDPLNSFTTLVTAAVLIPGIPTTIQVTTVLTGYYTTLPFVTSAALVYVLSPDTGFLAGGADLITTLLDSTCQMLGDCWGIKKSWGHTYLAAHFATLASGGGGGIVSARAIDKISESYAVSPPSDPDLGSTKWGLLYLALRKTLPNLGIVVGRSGYGMVGIVGGCCG